LNPPPARVIALGASNLTRGFPTVVAAARASAGSEVEILAALGLGRSYGMESRVLARTLPGILECGIWKAIDDRPPAPTRALITDVGNDILYGAPTAVILEWVDEALRRLRRVTGDIVVTGLPLDSIRRLSPRKFVAFRTLLFHRNRASLAQILDASEQVHAGLIRLAANHGARFVPLRREWYGFDPVHVRPGRWRAAWREIVGTDASTEDTPSVAEAVRLLAMPPERQRLFGLERLNPQHGARLRQGGRVWLF
jgi:hypothetical protein